MSTWQLAPTLRALRDEINARWPNRDKTSDGTIGNLAHQGGSSDHNPDARGVVCALDIDEDLASGSGFNPGQGARVLVDELLALARGGYNAQLYYLIYEAKIYSRTYGWVARDYFGANTHGHHVHISVYHPPELADRTTPWGIDMPTPEEIADATLERDGKISNAGGVFTPNADNKYVSIATALYEMQKDIVAIKKKLGI